MDFLLLSAFYIFLYLHGRGVFFILSKHFNSIDSSYKVEIFYPIIGLFYLGNFSLIFNFFSGINNIFFYLFAFLPVLINLRFIHLRKINMNYIIFNSVTLLVLSASFKQVGLHKDASLYHLSYQNWIRSEQIFGGLTNLHGRFGYSSIYDYISSIFWVDENLILLHAINLSFFTLFANFLFYTVYEKQSVSKNLYFSSLFVIAYSLLDNFGFGGGRNGYLYIEGIGKQDAAFGIVFYIGSILLFDLIATKKFDKRDIFLVTLLALFAFELRVMGALLLIFTITLLIKSKTLVNKNSILIFLISIMWSIKNLIISSCFYYPVVQSCVNLFPWSNLDVVINDSISIANFHVALSAHNNFTEWKTHWLSSELNKIIAFNLLFSFISLFSATLLLGKFKKFKIYNLLLFIYISIYIFLWINQAPDFRLGIGFTLLLFGYIGFLIESLRFNFEIYLKPSLIYFLILISFLLLPRMFQFKSLLENFENFSTVTEKSIDYTKNENSLLYFPTQGEDCGTKYNCSPFISKFSKIYLGENILFKYIYNES